MDHQISAVVVEHAGKSYIRVLASGYYSDAKYIAANGVSGLSTAPGDTAFLVYEGPTVSTLQRVIPARRIVTKYELRADLRGSPKAETISVADYGNLSDGDRAIYSAVYEDIPQGSEDIPFVVQQEKGPPSQLPQGVFCTDKNSFARFPSFHHLGPVRASPKYVLWRLANAFHTIIGGNPYITDSMHGVGRSVDQAHREMVQGYQDSFFITMKPMTVNGIEVTAKGVPYYFTTDKEKNVSYGMKVAAIDGNSLADLEANISAFITKTTQPHRKWVQPNNCPCCQRRFTKKASAK